MLSPGSLLSLSSVWALNMRNLPERMLQELPRKCKLYQYTLMLICPLLRQVGSDDDSYSVRMKFKHFARYLRDSAHASADDSPLYIFDGTFADREGSKAMRQDYEVGRSRTVHISHPVINAVQQTNIHEVVPCPFLRLLLASG